MVPPTMAVVCLDEFYETGVGLGSGLVVVGSGVVIAVEVLIVVTDGVGDTVVSELDISTYVTVRASIKADLPKGGGTSVAISP
jgi:hypothetical protein